MVGAGFPQQPAVGSLAAVAALLAVFALVETRAAAPMMPPRIFRHATIRVANLAAVLVFGTFTALFFFASIFMQRVFEYSPITAGLAYVPLGVAVVVGAGIASTLITRVSARSVLTAGLVVTVAGLLLLARAPVGGHYAVDLLPAFLALGAAAAWAT